MRASQGGFEAPKTLATRIPVPMAPAGCGEMATCDPRRLRAKPHRFLLRVTSHSAKYASCSCLTLGVHSVCVRALRTQMLEIEFHRPCQALAAQISGEAFAVAILPVSLWFDVARPRARLRQPPPQLFGHELGSLSERMFSGFPRYGIARLMRTSITHIIILPFTDLTELRRSCRTCAPCRS
jgi:hypothetical protein